MDENGGKTGRTEGERGERRGAGRNGGRAASYNSPNTTKRHREAEKNRGWEAAPHRYEQKRHPRAAGNGEARGCHGFGPVPFLFRGGAGAFFKRMGSR